MSSEESDFSTVSSIIDKAKHDARFVQNPDAFAYRFRYYANAGNYYRQELNFFSEHEKGRVINICGESGTGKSLMAMRIAYDIAKRNKYKIAYTWSFERAFTVISPKTILVVEQGEKLKYADPLEHEFGMIQIKARATQQKAVVIVITDQPLDFNSDVIYECLFVENGVLTSMMKTQSMYVGKIKLEVNFVQALQDASDRAKADYLRPIMERIMELISDDTEEVLEALFKHPNIIFARSGELRKSENAIIPVRCIAYGGMGSGKSTLAEIIHALSKAYYNEYDGKGKLQKGHVHAVKHESNLLGLLTHGFSKNSEHFIQMIVAEDFTYSKTSLFDLKKYIRLRHTMNEATGGSDENKSAGLQEGLAISYIGLHKLTGEGAHTGVRSFVDFLFILEKPSELWMQSYIKRYAGSDYLEFLDEVDELKKEAERKGDKDEFNRLKGYGICVGRGWSLPFYLHADQYICEEIPVLELPDEPLEALTTWEGWQIDIIQKASLTLSEDFRVFGANELNIPKLDVDIVLGYILEKHPKTRNMSPNDRKNLANEVLQRAKYLAWLDHNDEFQTLERNWASDWQEYVTELLVKFEDVDKIPQTHQVYDEVVELDIQKYGRPRKRKHAGIDYYVLIKNKVLNILRVNQNDADSLADKSNIINLEVPKSPDAFINIFKEEMKKMIAEKNPTAYPSHVLWFIEYFTNQSFKYSDIKNIYSPDLTKSAIGDGIRKIRDSLSNTAKGDVLEKSLKRFFGTFQQNYIRRGKTDEKRKRFPDLQHSECEDLVINCKFFLDDEPLANVSCSPEWKYEHCWLALYTKDKGLVMYHNENNYESVNLDTHKPDEEEKNLLGQSVEKYLEWVAKNLNKYSNLKKVNK